LGKQSKISGFNEFQKAFILWAINKRQWIMRSPPGKGKSLAATGLFLMLRRKLGSGKMLVVTRTKDFMAFDIANVQRLLLLKLSKEADMCVLYSGYEWPADIYLVSDSLLSKVVLHGTADQKRALTELLSRVNLLIVDEAHALRVHSSARTKAFLKVSTYYHRLMARDPERHRIGFLTACVIGETLLFSNRGLIRADSVVEGDLLWSPSGFRAVSKFIRNGVVPVWKVVTSQGFSLTGSYNHPVWTHRGWVEMQHIRSGDLVQCGMVSQLADVPNLSFSLPRPKKLKRGGFRNFLGSVTVDESFGAFLGWLTGDGYLCSGDRRVGLVFAENDLPLAPFFENFFNSLGLKAECKERRFKGSDSRGVPRNESQYSIRVSCNQLRNFILDQGYSLAGAKEASVPDCILQSGYRVQCSYLKFLFGADGHFAVRDGVLRRIVLTSVSFKLVSQVRLMLMGLGIMSRIYSVPQKGHDGIASSVSLQLIVASAFFSRFVDLVGVVEFKCKWRRLAGPSHKHPQLLKDTYQEIVSVECLGEAETFGVTIDGGEYFTNGILSHNTPVYKELENYHSIFACLCVPNPLGTWHQFLDRFCVVEQAASYGNRKMFTRNGSHSYKGQVGYTKITGYKNVAELDARIGPYIFSWDKSDFKFTFKVHYFGLSEAEWGEYQKSIRGLGLDKAYAVDLDVGGERQWVYRNKSDTFVLPGQRHIVASDLVAGMKLLFDGELVVVRGVFPRDVDAGYAARAVKAQQCNSRAEQKLALLVDLVRSRDVGALIYFNFLDSVEVAYQRLCKEFPGRRVVQLTGRTKNFTHVVSSVGPDDLVLMSSVASQSIDMYIPRLIVMECFALVPGKLNQLIGRMTRENSSFRDVSVDFILREGESVDAYFYSKLRLRLKHLSSGQYFDVDSLPVVDCLKNMPPELVDEAYLKERLLWSGA
jgi:hypothetical protein